MNVEKLWTKDFITLSLINFFVFVVHLLLMVIVATYALEKFQARTSTAGLVASIFIIGALVGRFCTGWVIEKIGCKKVLTAGTVFFIGVVGSYFAAVSLPALILIRFLHGAAHGVTSTAAGTLVAKVIPAKRRGEGIGYYGLSIVLASALGPFAGILLIQYVDFTLVFLVTATLAVLVFFIAFTVHEPSGVPLEPDKESMERPLRLSQFFELKAVPISVIAAVIGFSASVVIAFMPLYAKAIQLDKAAGVYFVVNALASLVSRPISGRLFDLKGANIVIYPSLAFYALGMMLFSQAGNGFVLLTAGAIIGVGYGNFMSCAQALTLKGIPPQRFGLATATYYVFLDFGIGVGPYLLGMLVPQTGYRGLFFLMALLGCSTILLYHFLVGRKI